MALAHGALPTGDLTLAGPRAQIYATGPGQTGGVAAHARLLTGLVGLLDHGARMRPGPHGPAVRKKRLPPAS